MKKQTKSRPPVDSLIDVGNIRLQFRIYQGARPTILLEVGGGADSTFWGPFAPLLARETGATIVTYDRAGFGKSDLPETPYDMVEETEWLWKGLCHLGYDKNLILVGHSYGGWRVRLTASEHPDAISGMVFVDPFNTGFVDILGWEYLDNHPMSSRNPPFDTSNPDALTKNQRGLMRMIAEGLGPKVEIMGKTSIPQGIPVRIITAGKPWWGKPEEDRAWRVAHEQMTASIEGAVLLVAEQSDHMIPENQPEIIVAAVNELIRDVHF